MSLREEALKRNARLLHPTPLDMKAPSPKSPLHSSSWTINQWAYSDWKWRKTSLFLKTVKEYDCSFTGPLFFEHDRGKLVTSDKSSFPILDTPPILAELLRPDFAEIFYKMTPGNLLKYLLHMISRIRITRCISRLSWRGSIISGNRSNSMAPLQTKGICSKSPCNREGPRALQSKLKTNSFRALSRCLSNSAKLAFDFSTMVDKEKPPALPWKENNYTQQKCQDWDYSQKRAHESRERINWLLQKITDSWSTTKPKEKAWKVFISRLLVIKTPHLQLYHPPSPALPLSQYNLLYLC